MTDQFLCGACPCWRQGECRGGPAKYGELCSAYEGGRREPTRQACWGRILELMDEGKKKKEKKSAGRQLAMWQEAER